MKNHTVEPKLKKNIPSENEPPQNNSLQDVPQDKLLQKLSQNNKPSHSLPKRIGAVLGLIFILFCILGLLINIILGGDAKVTLLFLFGLIVVPAVFYVFLMTVRISGFHAKSEDGIVDSNQNS